MKSLVSILIPAHNSERWIGGTLQSAVNQTWPKKEIIVVDDGSSDRTYEIARCFESHNVKIVRQENRGASAARNSALTMAQGDYIQWLDADDLLEPEKVRCQMKEVGRGFGAATLFSGSFVEFYARPEKGKITPNPLYRDYEPVDWLVTKFRENAWLNPAVWLVSRPITERAGTWDERLSLDDDGEYFARVVAASQHVHFVPEAKVYYRQWHYGSLSRTTSDKACRSLFLSLSLSVSYLRRLEDSDRTRKACMNLLQTWCHYFYPDKPNLYEKICSLAKEMGGTITPPTLTWKYGLIQRMFGWSAAKKARGFVATMKLSSSFKLDYLLFVLSTWER